MLNMIQNEREVIFVIKLTACSFFSSYVFFLIIH